MSPLSALLCVALQMWLTLILLSKYACGKKLYSGKLPTFAQLSIDMTSFKGFPTTSCSNLLCASTYLNLIPKSSISESPACPR